MGGSHSLACNRVARNMWLWARDRDLWLSAAHIPGRENVIADKSSREFDRETEWMLNPKTFDKLMRISPLSPKIDLFSSRLNKQIEQFVAWHPDPDAIAVDAFSLNWNNICFYAFPPFSIIHRTLKKIIETESTGVLIVPYWTGATWFPLLMRMLIAHPVYIQPHKHLLQQAGQPELLHPLHKKLGLLSCSVSGKACKARSYLTMLKTLSWHHGEAVQINNMVLTLSSGKNTAVDEI